MPTILSAPAVPSSNHRMIRALTLVLCCMFAAGCHLGVRKRSVGVVGVRLEPGVEISALEVRNPVGRIQVRDCTEAQAAGVEVEVLLTEHRPSSDFVPEAAEHVRMRRDGGRLFVDSAHAQDADARDWQLRMTVYLPGAAAVSARQDVGSVDVELAAVNGIDVVVDTGSVEVDVAELRGPASLEVDTGRIEFASAAVAAEGDMMLRCDTGSIRITWPEQASGRFDLAADCGNISVPDRFGLDPHRSGASSRCRGAFGAGGPQVLARTDTGSIRVR